MDKKNVKLIDGNINEEDKKKIRIIDGNSSNQEIPPIKRFIGSESFTGIGGCVDKKNKK